MWKGQEDGPSVLGVQSALKRINRQRLYCAVVDTGGQWIRSSLGGFNPSWEERNMVMN